MKTRIIVFIIITVSCLSCKKDKTPDTVSGLYDLYVVDPNTGVNTNITNSPDDMEFPMSFTNDSKKVLFKTYGGVYTVSPDGSDLQILFPVAANEKSDLQLSNNGEKFAFTSDGVLYLLNYDGTNELNLVKNYRYKLWKPIWSKDDNYIACSSDNGIVLVDMNGDFETITADKPADWYDWSFNSGKLVYSKFSDNTFPEIYVFDRATKKESQLTSTRRYNYSASWRPGKSEIIFTSSYGSEGSDLTQMSADASVQKIILHQSTLTSPAWSPDGNRIAFINENSDLAIIDVTGENYKVLNTIPGACLQPVWSPDGKYILYNRAVYYN